MSGSSRLLQNIKRTFKEFSESISLHGVAYLTGSRMDIIVAWCIAIALSLISASIILHSAVSFWNANPVVTVIDTSQLPVQEVQVRQRSNWFKPHRMSDLTSKIRLK